MKYSVGGIVHGVHVTVHMLVCVCVYMILWLQRDSLPAGIRTFMWLIVTHILH